MSDPTRDFGDELLVCPCGHTVADHDAWGCVHGLARPACTCSLVPSAAIDAATSTEGGE